MYFEFATGSMDGVNLFDEDLGLGATEGDEIDVDVISAGQSITCTVHDGSQTKANHAKVICNYAA